MKYHVINWPLFVLFLKGTWVKQKIQTQQCVIFKVSIQFKIKET